MENACHSCNLCHIKYIGPSGLWHHNKSVHECVKYSCNSCEEIFNRQNDLNVHIIAKHVGLKLVCDQCNFSTTYKDTLKIHKRVKHDGILPKCDECDETFTKQSHITRHKKRKHTGITKDITRHKKFAKIKERHNLSKHKPIIHDILTRAEENSVLSASEAPLSKNQDEFSNDFKSFDKLESKASDQYYIKISSNNDEPASLIDERERKEETDNNVFELSCNKYDNLSEKKGAWITQTFIKPFIIDPNKISMLDNDWEGFECNQCDKQYRHRNGLYIHKTVVHLGKRKCCPRCDFITTTKCHLNTHIKRVHDKQYFRCNLCGKELSRRGLADHKKVAHEGILHECNDCGSTLSTSGNLSTHKAEQHKEIRLFCTQCVLSFNRKRSLDNHMKSKHDSGERIKCKDCVKYFATSNSLLSHRRSKHENITYSCDMCSHTSTQKGNVKSHKRKKHNILI